MSVIVLGTPPPGLDTTEVLPDDIRAARFDTAAEHWTVTTADGHRHTGGVVVDARPSGDPTIAAHGVPNWFRIPGPDVARQTRYVARCLQLMQRSGASRIEANGRVVLHRWRPQRLAACFDLNGGAPGGDDLYDGPATVTVGGHDVATRVRLTGHLDAVDGRYHWQGTVFEALPTTAQNRSTMTVTVADRTVPARLVEHTPWGAQMVAGVGDPPFAR